MSAAPAIVTEGDADGETWLKLTRERSASVTKILTATVSAEVQLDETGEGINGSRRQQSVFIRSQMDRIRTSEHDRRSAAVGARVARFLDLFRKTNNEPKVLTTARARRHMTARRIAALRSESLRSVEALCRQVDFLEQLLDHRSRVARTQNIRLLAYIARMRRRRVFGNCARRPNAQNAAAANNSGGGNGDDEDVDDGRNIVGERASVFLFPQDPISERALAQKRLDERARAAQAIARARQVQRLFGRGSTESDNVEQADMMLAFQGRTRAPLVTSASVAVTTSADSSHHQSSLNDEPTSLVEQYRRQECHPAMIDPRLDALGENGAVLARPRKRRRQLHQNYAATAAESVLKAFEAEPEQVFPQEQEQRVDAAWEATEYLAALENHAVRRPQDVDGLRSGAIAPDRMSRAPALTFSEGHGAVLRASTNETVPDTTIPVFQRPQQRPNRRRRS